MQYPNSKVVSKFGSGLLRDAIIYYLIKLFDDKVYDERRECPSCGSTHVIRFDWAKRIFCKVIPKDGVFKDIVVHVKRFILPTIKHDIYGDDDSSARRILNPDEQSEQSSQE